MYSATDWKKGRQVVKLISGHGMETASIREVVKCDPKKGFVYLDANDICDDGQNTYRIKDGTATFCFIPGFSHRIVPVEE